MKFIFTFFVFCALFLVPLKYANAQDAFDLLTPEEDLVTVSTESATASPSAERERRLSEDVTRVQPSEDEALALFKQRPTDQISPTNFVAYMVQAAVKSGVPSRTVILILLLPLLATFVAFIRHVIGLPSMGMLVPIALSITLLSTGITAGMILLLTIIFSSTIARILLKKIRIMQLPKMALSMFIVSIFIFFVLTLSAMSGLVVVQQLSIFPVLLLILLSEQIVAVQLERSTQEMLIISLVTFSIGIFGYLILSSVYLRNTVLLYPELMFFLIPLNIVIGRYFGLRLMEYFRFSSIMRHGSN